ncbi:MAG: hypothetical protein EOM52_06190 [Clostridia bacterium]|nr:hypothetical protein [Clostridia bacterium]
MEYPTRKHPRLKEYDYSQGGAYFLTVCSKDKASIFAAVGRDDLGAPLLRLTNAGVTVERYVRSIPDAYPYVTLEHYIVMPNHIHLLLLVGDGRNGAPGSSRPTQVIPRLVAALKRLSNRDAGCDLWQTSYHDHIIRDENDFLNHWSYIDSNPARWAEDEYYTSKE